MLGGNATFCLRCLTVGANTMRIVAMFKFNRNKSGLWSFTRQMRAVGLE